MDRKIDWTPAYRWTKSNLINSRRERERERDRERERQRERQRDRDRQTEREREPLMKREIDRKCNSAENSGDPDKKQLLVNTLL